MSKGIKKEPTPIPTAVGAVTRADGETALIHLIESVLLYTPGSQVHASLIYEGADTIIDFLNFSSHDLDGFEVQEQVPLPKRDKRKLKNLLKWAKYLHKKDMSTSWKQLAKAQFDQFLLEVAPTMDTEGGAVPKSNDVARFQSNVKLDVKTYPAFDGELGNWLKFKRSVLALAATHNLLDVFNEQFIPPTNPGQAKDLYEAKNTFVYSIWTARVYGPHPVQILRQFENTTDGRGAYFAFLDYYESASNLDDASIIATNKLNNLVFTSSSTGGLPTFVNNFRQYVLDLEEAGKPMDAGFQRTLFLSKIQHKDYDVTKDLCLEDSSYSITDCIHKMEAKYKRLSASDKTRQSPRRVNRAITAAEASKLSMEEQIKIGYRIPAEKWVTMSFPEQVQFKRDRNKKFGKPPKGGGGGNGGGRGGGRGSGNNGGRSNGNGGQNVPQSNYGTINANTIQQIVDLLQSSGPPDHGGPASGGSIPAQANVVETPNLRSILRSNVRHMNITRAVVIHNVRTLEDEGYAVVDSGADTCLLGSEFYIESYNSMRTVEVLGFNNERGKESGLHIGSGICAVDVMGGDPVLLKVHEGVVMPQGKSLLSSNQLRHFGTQVHDTPIMYGGLQRIILPDGMCLPLTYKGALTNLRIRKPTTRELATIEPIEVTSPVPWDPHQPYVLSADVQEGMDHDGLADPPDQVPVVPARGGVSLSNAMIISDDEADHDPPAEVIQPKIARKRRQGKKKSKRVASTNPTQVKEEDRDWDHIQKCLAWKPLDVCEHTLKATTQYAKNQLRLPLRDHFKARFPALNVRRLNETFATDTFFASCKAQQFTTKTKNENEEKRRKQFPLSLPVLVTGTAFLHFQNPNKGNEGHSMNFSTL